LNKVYIAAPLFNDREKAYNQRICNLIEPLGFTVYLPQRDGGAFAEMVAQGSDPEAVSAQLYKRDIAAVRDCDILLFLMDGRVPDEGACVELGMAYAHGKTCIALKTDVRAFINGLDNLMLRQSLSRICRDEAELLRHLKELRTWTE
jgi:nucleoside 2-deoxyribosyltransferase